MFKKNLFTLLVMFLIIVLPFYVILAVWFTSQAWIANAGFYIKELVLVLLFLSLVFEFIRNKKLPSFDIIDYLIFWYIAYWVWITLANWLWLNSIVYGWRYDFIFFGVFLILKHWKQFIQVNDTRLLKTFIISWWLSLLFSILIKFRLWEQALLMFGFTEYTSNWTYSWSIPNYHWLENSWIKRFQWIFDWPNQMAFFIILYASVFMHYIKKKFEYHIILILVVFFSLLIITYSRSALLWVFSWVWLLVLLNLNYIYKKYKKVFISWILIILLSIFWIFISFNENLKNIILRSSSTTGHFDRMEIGLERFESAPMWLWLAEAGPAYRSIYPDLQTKEAEKYYIPESWFIQQLIEWGIIYFSLFCYILILLLINMYKNSKPLFIWLIAILVMNVFLHIFEATYLSILLFIFVGLIYKKWIKLS